MATSCALDTWSLGSGSWSLYYFPDRQSWRGGDHHIVCALGGEDPTEGSLRSDRTTLTPGQLAFLTLVNPIEDAAHEEPEDDPGDALEDNRAWAADVRTAIDAARTGLRARTWEASARKKVEALPWWAGVWHTAGPLAAGVDPATPLDAGRWTKRADHPDTRPFDGHPAARRSLSRR